MWLTTERLNHRFISSSKSIPITHSLSFSLLAHSCKLIIIPFTYQAFCIYHGGENGLYGKKIDGYIGSLSEAYHIARTHAHNSILRLCLLKLLVSPKSNKKAGMPFILIQSLIYYQPLPKTSTHKRVKLLFGNFFRQYKHIHTSLFVKCKSRS